MRPYDDKKIQWRPYNQYDLRNQMETVFRFSERVVPYGMTGRTDNPKQRSHRCCSALLSQTPIGRRFLPVGMVANGVQISGDIILIV